jgi:purine nucleosidase
VIASYDVGRRPAPGYAAAEIARHVMENPGEITIVAVGPLTNVAAAIALEPRLVDAVQEIVIMGGVFLTSTQNRDMPGEFNVWVDPEAAAAVLRSGAEQRWVGLDVTLQVRLTRADAAELSAASGSFSQLAGESTLAWIEAMHQGHPGDPQLADSCAMHDPLAVAALTRPDLLTFRDAQVDIVTGDGIARGVMITDLLQRSAPPQANVSIATAVRADDFTRYFLDSIRRL